jgi:hypothetical protein
MELQCTLIRLSFLRRDSCLERWQSTRLSMSIARPRMMRLGPAIIELCDLNLKEMFHES